MRDLRSLVVATLTALLLVSCNAVQDLVSVTPDEYLSFTVSASELPADGQSTVTLSVVLSNAAGPDRRTIRFQSNLGALVGRHCDGFGNCDDFIDVVADINGNASALLQSATVLGDALVQARSGEIAKSVRVKFGRAYPDRITVSPDRGSLQACFGDSTTVEVRLYRNVGKVTEATTIELSATIAGLAFGSFPSTVASDGDGIASFQFSPGTSPALGVGLILARVYDPVSGREVQGGGTVEVVAPDPFSSVCQ